MESIAGKRGLGVDEEDVAGYRSRRVKNTDEKEDFFKLRRKVAYGKREMEIFYFSLFNQPRIQL